ncbi:MAG TPA: hypothetical protein VFO28_08475 [Burkholderiaceae bacterium]|nr:hypothetical protein [Burkholderiaceae bacterium]
MLLDEEIMIAAPAAAVHFDAAARQRFCGGHATLLENTNKSTPFGLSSEFPQGCPLALRRFAR